MAVYETEDQIRGLKVDFGAMAGLDCFGVIVTAPGLRSDFVSRFFAPGAGIPQSSHRVGALYTDSVLV